MTARKQPLLRPDTRGSRLSRRALLAALATLLPTAGFLPLALRRRGMEWLWPLDLTGDGRVGNKDRALLAAAGKRVRGARPKPRRDWDPRLDFEARGRVADDALATYDRVRPALGTELPARPIVTCFHYGWYTPGRRLGELPTVRYLGGTYGSRNTRTEVRFNELKAEFGIDADLLSWIDHPSVLTAYERGYLRANNRPRRLTGALYESNINLGTTDRMDFAFDGPYAPKLITDFQAMATWLLEVARSGPILERDGRPVIYLFGSHTWGTDDANLPAVGAAIAAARVRFTDIWGTPPYLIGDESLFPIDEEVGPDRLFRASFFDAVTRYHHYDRALVTELGGGADTRMGNRYRRTLVDLERRTIEGYAEQINRYNFKAVSVIPSLAAGFAKEGLPTLVANHGDFRRYIETMLELYLEHLNAVGADPDIDAPLVLVGSWNEEFEGHALMPAKSSLAVTDRSHDGFEWLYALKSIFGATRG